MIHLPDGMLEVLDAVWHQKATAVLNVRPASLPALATDGVSQGLDHGLSETLNKWQ
jgi:hypothetical protein